MYSSFALSLGVARGTAEDQRSGISGETSIKMHSIFNTPLLVRGQVAGDRWL